MIYEFIFDIVESKSVSTLDHIHVPKDKLDEGSELEFKSKIEHDIWTHINLIYE